MINSLFAKKREDLKALRSFSLLLLLPLIIEVISIFTEGNSYEYTLGLYFFYLVYTYLTCIKLIKYQDFIILFLIYGLFLLSYILFPDGREYYLKMNMLMVYLIYLPLCVFIFRKIVLWDNLFNIIKPFAIIADVIAVYIGFNSHLLLFSEYFSYMEFSYFLLPFVCIQYAIFRGNNTKKKQKILFAVGFVLTLLAIVLYGARATVGFVAAFIIMVEFFNSKASSSSKIIIIISFCIIVMLVAFFFDSIVAYLSQVQFFNDSRFIQKLSAGQLLESSGRDVIYKHVKIVLSDLDIKAYGPFGDRQFCLGIYPHNIALELILQFGWVFGVLFTLFFIYLCYTALFNTKYHIIATFFICSFLGRYLISGSYLIEGYFWIAIFSLWSLIKSQSRQKFYAKSNSLTTLQTTLR